MLTAQEAFILTGSKDLEKEEFQPILNLIIEKIEEAANQGKSYIILKSKDVVPWIHISLRKLGYKVHHPLEFIGVCVIKWNSNKMHITNEELANPISLKL